MLSEHIEAALGGPVTIPALEEIARTVWRALEAEVLSWEEAGRLDGLIRARRDRMGAGHGGPERGVGPVRASWALPGALRRPRRPRSPERQASVERRRRVASCGALPPDAAGWFTEGQRAALSVVGREAARGRPWCDWSLDRIAALAGVGRTTVRDALRLAERQGLVRVRERRRRGAKSDTNVVSITAKAWWRWLKRGPKGLPAEGKGGPAGGTGSERSDATDTQELRRGQKGTGGGVRHDGPPHDKAQRSCSDPPGAGEGVRIAPRGAAGGELSGSPRLDTTSNEKERGAEAIAAGESRR